MCSYVIKKYRSGPNIRLQFLNILNFYSYKQKTDFTSHNNEQVDTVLFTHKR